MRRLVFAAILVCFAAGAAFCEDVTVLITVQRNFTIFLEYSGKPLEMQVSVSDIATGKVVRQVTTDAHGRAEIRGLEVGAYRVTSPVSDDEINVIAQGGSDDVHVTALFDRAPVELAAVSGTITDATGAVIPGAVVVLEQLDAWHSPVAAGTTDASGSVSLKAKEGLYQLRVASQGFRTAVIPLRITRNGRPEFKFTLQIGSH